MRVKVEPPLVAIAPMLIVSFFMGVSTLSSNWPESPARGERRNKKRKAREREKERRREKPGKKEWSEEEEKTYLLRC